MRPGDIGVECNRQTKSLSALCKSMCQFGIAEINVRRFHSGSDGGGIRAHLKIKTRILCILPGWLAGGYILRPAGAVTFRGAPDRSASERRIGRSAPVIVVAFRGLPLARPFKLTDRVQKPSPLLLGESQPSVPAGRDRS